ncbi:MAG: hypothetical protein U0R27_09715 [Candidatus Nanopelagicales bacterium]|jgi:hypothetical protein|nr:hypothetical protein [Actinomycetota bacterium]HNE87983.1 hypothetical protein [Actinomycetota bacterium]HNL50765.1 hypothetical protein [Actinomycetota bacterium]HNO14639.1 hypothetical protein [Actinomycetota bacterium]HUM86868.1 hypothetical protein [Actinomycetota bacterium]
MKRVMVLVVALLAALIMAGCSSGSPERAEPFVGQWESTGGEQIQMRVDPPTDGEYPVQITGEGVDLSLSASQTGDQVYEAKSTSAEWTFRMVDDDLLNATGTPEGQASATTSFKRIGG